MGCGTGFVARQLGQRKDFQGRVLGVDLSPHLVEAATRLSSEQGLSAKVRFSVGDTRSLDLADASFDAVLPHTLVSHVYDAAAVIREAARVVRPGGVVVVFDGDYGSLTVGTDDPAEGAKMDAAIIASVCASPRVMRAMPRLLQKSGLQLESSMAYILAEIGRADYWAGMLNSLPVLLPNAGLVDRNTAEAFVAAQRKASDEGTFFCAANFYTYIARWPA
jgi:SAM-dependent methyltransferase